MLEDYYLGTKALWKFTNDSSLENQALIISAKLGLPVLLSKVLVKRGLFDTSEIINFLKPSIKNLHDPMLLPDMEKAATRILEARELKQRIIIYGDYDVDGVAATSILLRFFKHIGIDASYYIPDRAVEGYGISDIAVEYLLQNPYDLMITVDCGISAKETIRKLHTGLTGNNRKMDIIITDHHQPHPDSLPEVYATVNPHLPESIYPFKGLCGAGIAFKLVQALCRKLELGDIYINYVDLAALATVADIVKLKDENRIIVWAGIKKIIRKPNLGIKSLIAAAEALNREIDTWMLAFILSPRVNAAGRMGNASRGVQLFTTDDSIEAEKLAMEMNRENYQRQKTQEYIFKKAVETIESEPYIMKKKVIVVYGDNWHHGVLGIVASMLADRYYKPCFVLSLQDGIATGSARSVEGFNIFSGMEYCADLIVKYGGHTQAGGLTLEASNVQMFIDRINEFADKTMNMEDLVPKIYVDVEADINDLNIETAEAITALAPFGEGNTVPVFRSANAKVLYKKRVGPEAEHMALVLGDGQNTVQAIAFRMGELEPYIEINQRIDLVYTVRVNEYMGNKSVQLVIKAIRVPENEIFKNRFFAEAAEKLESLDYSEDWIYNEIINHRVNIEDIRLSRAELAVLYRYIRNIGSCTLNRVKLFNLTQKIGDGTTQMNYFKLLAGMLIFDELDFIRFSYTEKGDYELQVPEVVEKVSLEESVLYNFLQNVQQAVEQ